MTTTTHCLLARRPTSSAARWPLRLSAGTDELSYEVGERLRAARVRALAARKQAEVHVPVVVGRGGAATLGEGRQAQPGGTASPRSCRCWCWWPAWC
jgi:hypothetical protein